MLIAVRLDNFGGFTVVDCSRMAQFAVRAIAGLIENGQHSVEVTEQAYWKFADILDEFGKGHGLPR